MVDLKAEKMVATKDATMAALRAEKMAASMVALRVEKMAASMVATKVVN